MPGWFVGAVFWLIGFVLFFYLLLTFKQITLVKQTLVNKTTFLGFLARL